MSRTLRGKVAVAGIGQTKYYKWGQSPDPEFKLVLRAILAACEDAGISPTAIDGFSSYSGDRNEATRLAQALGIDDLRLAVMQWGGGGGGVAGAVANASAAIATGQADCVVVFRGLAQGEFGRFGQGMALEQIAGPYALSMPYGLMSPAQMFAMRTNRFMHDHGVKKEALRAISLASYHHAQNNPDAIMKGRPLSAADYDASRWIVEPFQLFDCCQENDGAAAVILVSAERAAELPHNPCYLLGAVGGAAYRADAAGHNDPIYASSNFTTLAPRLYEMGGFGPADVDVVQSYENFTGGVMMALVEHGLCAPEEVNDFLVPDNLIAPKGRLPLNTSGGNLAEAYMHGLGLVIEAIRQIRGTSSNPVEGVDVSLMTGGPMVAPASCLAFGSEATL